MIGGYSPWYIEELRSRIEKNCAEKSMQLGQGMAGDFADYRYDPEAALFGFDQYGHVYIHETTHHSIRRLWEQLFVTDQHAASRPAPLGMTLPHVGPSEDIAEHAPGYPRPRNPGL